MAKVKAFEYDNSSTGSDAPVTFAVIPGVWTPGEAVLPAAFGMSLEQMREAVHEFGLPLKEVSVDESKATAELDRGPNHLPVEGQTVRLPDKPSDASRETAAGPIPAAAPAATRRPLHGLAAAMEARNTVLARGGSLEDAAKAARDAGGRYGDPIADMTEMGALQHEEAVAQRDADEAGTLTPQHETQTSSEDE